MLSYSLAASAVKFTHERTDFLKTVWEARNAHSDISLESTMLSGMGDKLESRTKDFRDAMARLERLTHEVLMPSLKEGQYGSVALESKILLPFFEPLGASAHEQTHQIRNLYNRLKAHVGEMQGPRSLAWGYGSDLVLENKSEIKLWKEAEYRILELYAAPRCLEWMISFQKRALPREVRDLIYAHLIDGLKVQDEPHIRVQPSGARNPPTELYITSDIRDALFQHLWVMNPDFVGLEPACDIAQVYFADSSFCLPRAEFLPGLLNFDPFNVGFRPFDSIRRVTILETLDFQHLHGNLMHLCRIKQKGAFELDLRLLTPFPNPRKNFITTQDERRMVCLLEDLRYPIYELIHSGSKVNIWQVITKEEKPCYAHRRLTRFSKDISRSLNIRQAPTVDFFTLTAEEWKLEKDEEGDVEAARHYLREGSSSEINNALRLRWRQTGALEGFEDVAWTPPNPFALPTPLPNMGIPLSSPPFKPHWSWAGNCEKMLGSEYAGE